MELKYPPFKPVKRPADLPEQVAMEAAHSGGRNKARSQAPKSYPQGERRSDISHFALCGMGQYTFQSANSNSISGQQRASHSYERKLELQKLAQEVQREIEISRAKRRADFELEIEYQKRGRYFEPTPSRGIQGRVLPNLGPKFRSAGR